MKSIDTRSEDDQARTLEWMYRIFSGSATRKAKVEKGVPPMVPDNALTADPAEARQSTSDPAPPA